MVNKKRFDKLKHPPGTISILCYVLFNKAFYIIFPHEQFHTPQLLVVVVVVATAKQLDQFVLEQFHTAFDESISCK